MIKLINAINGNIRNTKRFTQLINVCDILDIKVINPIELTVDNAWFSGFFDADGTINYYYRNKDSPPTLGWGVGGNIKWIIN